MEENIFMICRQLNLQAFSRLPAGFAARTLRRDELSAWQAMPFDDAETAQAYSGYMDDYFRITYARDEEKFFADTIVICDGNDQMVATCLLWQAYGLYTTVHWFKVHKAYEGRGIGRALLSLLFKAVTAVDMPIYLHTQPESFRAIKLYSDFGFELLTDKWIGPWENHIAQCLPFLQAHMPRPDYEKLRFTTAPAEFLAGMATQQEEQF